jgi:BirA family biotin operon repressor/biotin-[acetyl-CoA-carboxylase] ligase
MATKSGARTPLDEAALRRAIVTPGGAWTDLRVVAETGSTNADLLDAAQAGAPPGAVLVAEVQQSGRGRLGRVWEAPAMSSITVSVLFRPGVQPVRLGWLPLLAGVALVEAVGLIAEVDAVLKWPNDLLVRPVAPATGAGYGKCAGVLAEASAGAELVVVGIGLNVDQTADELPPTGPSSFPPTSLVLAGARVTDRSDLLRGLLGVLAAWYGRWRDGEGDPDRSGLAAAYRASCLTLGTEVAVSLPGGELVTGRASDVDTEGRLIVTTASGSRHLAAGDVQHLR